MPIEDNDLDKKSTEQLCDSNKLLYEYYYDEKIFNRVEISVLGFPPSHYIMNNV